MTGNFYLFVRLRPTSLFGVAGGGYCLGHMTPDSTYSPSPIGSWLNGFVIGSGFGGGSVGGRTTGSPLGGGGGLFGSSGSGSIGSVIDLPRRLNVNAGSAELSAVAARNT